MEEKKKKYKKGHHRSSYKKEALQAAKDLFYGPVVMNQIREAKNDEEIRVIMCNARKSKR